MSDYIERGALMDKIEEQLACLREVDRNYYSYTNGYEDCYCEVKEAPAADVAPVVHGRWEYIPQTLDTLSQFRCSVCGWWSLDPSIDNAYNYCPNCGAKMGDGNE